MFNIKKIKINRWKKRSQLQIIIKCGCTVYPNVSALFHLSSIIIQIHGGKNKWESGRERESRSVKPTMRMRISSIRVCPLSSAWRAAVSTEITISPNISCRRVMFIRFCHKNTTIYNWMADAYNWKLEFRDMLGH